MSKTNNYRIEFCCGVAYLFLLIFSNYPAYVNLLPIIILGFVRLIIVIFVLLMDAGKRFGKKITNIFEEADQDNWTNFD
jgi:hypothetical protein